MRVSVQRRARHVATVHPHSEQLLARSRLLSSPVGRYSRAGQHRRIPVDAAPDPRADDREFLQETPVDGAAAGSRAAKGEEPEANERGGLALARGDAVRAAQSGADTGTEGILGVHLRLVADLCLSHGKNRARDFDAFRGALHQHQ